MAHHSDQPFDHQKFLRNEEEGLIDNLANKIKGLEQDPLPKPGDQPEHTPNQKLGATGNFPEGKLNPSDQGEIRFGIGTHNGKVIMDFGKNVSWIGLTAEQALLIAQCLTKHAHEITAKEQESKQQEAKEIMKASKDNKAST